MSFVTYYQSSSISIIIHMFLGQSQGHFGYPVSLLELFLQGLLMEALYKDFSCVRQRFISSCLIVLLIVLYCDELFYGDASDASAFVVVAGFTVS